ncbi:MAG TPA: RloB family protein [Steroidobacteraceae bacterium]|nr:RloB family protein [Steroidobacteraceae bacterium]
MRRRKAQSYLRREPVREPYDRVLIVCEGRKTEPFYFRGLRLHHRLSSAYIHITPANGSDPISIVEFAQARLSNFDRVYCVFDRDGHHNYEAALQKVAQHIAGQARKLIAIPSWPCFELWLLLHFRYSAAPINRAGRKSSGDRAIDELAQHWPDYRKSLENVYVLLSAKLPTALRHAMRLERENNRTKSRNPSTKVHELVQYLTTLKVK